MRRYSPELRFIASCGESRNGLRLSDFHLEFRFPDADLSPTAVTARMFLILALLLKSVDLSQYGVIHVGKIAPWRRKTYLPAF